MRRAQRAQRALMMIAMTKKENKPKAESTREREESTCWDIHFNSFQEPVERAFLRIVRWSLLAEIRHQLCVEKCTVESDFTQQHEHTHSTAIIIIIIIERAKREKRAALLLSPKSETFNRKIFRFSGVLE